MPVKPDEGHSRKSKMKRRPPEWEAAKEEIARELGLWEKVEARGWADLTAAESGKLGGVLSVRYPGIAPKEPPKGANCQKRQ